MAMEIIGVDAGGTWIKAARFRADLREVARAKIASGAREGVQAYVKSIAAAVTELGGEAAAVGLSLPGVFNRERTRIAYSPNVKGLDVGGSGLALEQIAAQIGSGKVVGENDAGCAALGEWANGICQADPKQYLLHLTWGTGIGVGVVIEGQSQYGWEGGHLPLRRSKEGVWSLEAGADLERQIAVPALVERLRGLYGDGSYETRFTEEDLKNDKEVPITLSRYAREEDGLAQEVVREALAGMAWALHVMALMVYPDVVTIGGAMMDSDWLLEELRQKVREYGQGILASSLKPEIIHRASLHNDAGMIGAAMLARQKFLTDGKGL